MLNDLITHCLGKKNRRILAAISIKWFHIIDIIIEIKLGLQHEPENLDVKKKAVFLTVLQYLI